MQRSASGLSLPDMLPLRLLSSMLQSRECDPMNAWTQTVTAKVLGMLRGPSHIRWMNRTIGSLFIVAGLFLATFRRHA